MINFNHKEIFEVKRGRKAKGYINLKYHNTKFKVEVAEPTENKIIVVLYNILHGFSADKEDQANASIELFKKLPYEEFCYLADLVKP